jgi:hypothetical protein
MGISTAFVSPELILALVASLVGGLVCALRPESIRSFATRHHPAVASRFRDPKAHRRFIQLCGWALLALAAGLSFTSFVTLSWSSSITRRCIGHIRSKSSCNSRSAPLIAG